MADKNAFSEREQQLMSLAWLCFDGEPKVDYKKLASLAGMSNPTSANNAWSKIKKKLVAQAAEVGGAEGGADGDEDGAATPKATKATPRKRSKKAADEDDAEETPAKKTKGRKGKAIPKKKQAEADGESGEDAPVKPEVGSDEDGLMT